jgi:hypothetical protein
MRYLVLSKRMDWPEGSVVDAAELAGCNIEMLVATGHLTPAPTPKKKNKWEPEPPVTDDDSADEPEE